MEDKEFEKIEDILKIKPNINVPEWNSEILKREPKYDLYSLNSYNYFFVNLTKIAAGTIFFLGISFLIYQQQMYIPQKEVSQIKNTSQLMGIAILVKGNVYMIDNNHQKTKVSSGNIIKNKVTIETEEKSEIQILLRNSSQIKISENTKVQLDYEKRRWTFFQEKGSTFHDVILRKGEKYWIETPTAIASVRGTFFKIDVEKDSEKIELLKGKLDITIKTDKKNEEAMLLESDSDFEKASNEENLDRKNFLKIDKKEKKISFKNEKNNKLFVIYVDMKEISEQFLVNNPNLWDEIEKVKIVEKPEDLEKVYNRRIEVIKLLNGNIYKGVIVSQTGESLILHSTDGVKILKTSEIMEINYENN